MATSARLDEKLAEVEATDAELIVIDLSGVSFIDSTGLRCLLKAHARTQPQGDRLRITEGQPQARRLFELAQVIDRLPFIPSAE